MPVSYKPDARSDIANCKIYFKEIIQNLLHIRFIFSAKLFSHPQVFSVNMIATNIRKISFVIKHKTAFMKEHCPNYFRSFPKSSVAAFQRTELSKLGLLDFLRENFGASSIK